MRCVLNSLRKSTSQRTGCQRTELYVQKTETCRIFRKTLSRLSVAALNCSHVIYKYLILRYVLIYWRFIFICVLLLSVENIFRYRQTYLFEVPCLISLAVLSENKILYFHYFRLIKALFCWRQNSFWPHTDRRKRADFLNRFISFYWYIYCHGEIIYGIKNEWTIKAETHHWERTRSRNLEYRCQLCRLIWYRSCHMAGALTPYRPLCRVPLAFECVHSIEGAFKM